MSSAMSRAVIVTNSVFTFVSGLSVILRIYTRKQQLPPLGADDFLVIASWVRPCNGDRSVLNIAKLDFLGSARSYQHHRCSTWRLWNTFRIFKSSQGYQLP